MGGVKIREDDAGVKIEEGEGEGEDRHRLTSVLGS